MKPLLLCFLCLLCTSSTGQAAADSLLYPKAQLDGFKSRVAAAKNYADMATVLFKSVVQVPAVSVRSKGAATSTVQKAIAAGKPLAQIGALWNGNLPADTFLLLKQLTRDTFTIKSRQAFGTVRPNKWRRLKTYEHATTDYKTVSVVPSAAQWIYKVEPKTKSEPAALYAYYTATPFQSSNLPLRYSRAVHYFRQLAGRGWPKWATFDSDGSSLSEDSNLKSLSAYLNAVAPHPFYSADDLYVTGDLTNEQRDSLTRVYKKWTVTRLQPIDSAYTNDPAFRALITRATAAALRRKEPNLGLVELLARFGDPKTALEINNFRFAYPVMCGNDYRLRISLLETGKLAAAAGNWPDFIWTHLFLSNADKSGWQRILYDWDNRYAYTRELEYLGIDVPEFLLGMALETESKMRKNTGSISALWRESSQPKAIEEVFKMAASDTSLDLYNRMACYWLLAEQFQYSGYPASETERTASLQKVAATLPRWVTTAEEE